MAWSPVRVAVVAVQVSAMKRRRVMPLSLVGGSGFRTGSCGGAGRGFTATADEDLLLALMVKVDVEDGGAAVVPDLFGDGEVKEDHAFGGLAGTDHGVAEERFGSEGSETGKGGIDVVEVSF